MGFRTNAIKREFGFLLKNIFFYKAVSSDYVLCAIVSKTCGKWAVKNIFFVSVTNKSYLNTYGFGTVHLNCEIQCNLFIYCQIQAYYS